MRQCLPELADTILQAWEAYQCLQRGTYLPFLLSGKEASERKRQQRPKKLYKFIAFTPPSQVHIWFIFNGIREILLTTACNAESFGKFFSAESRNRGSSYPFRNKSFQEECQEVWECIEHTVETDILIT